MCVKHLDLVHSIFDYIIYMTTILKKLIKFEKDLKKYLNRRAHGEIIRKEKTQTKKNQQKDTHNE